MTTEGGVGYRDLVNMDDKELGWWYQKCVDHNEELEARSKRK